MFYILIFIIILYFLLPKYTEHYDQIVATEKDNILAFKNALKNRCKKLKYQWIEGNTEDSWECAHTRETCLEDSIYPTLEDAIPQYYEWRPKTQRCIIGNEGYRYFCEKEGLTYNAETGECKTSREYCNKKGLPFCNGDCYIPPLQWLNEQIFGKTIGRTLSQGTLERGIAEALCRADEDEKKQREYDRKN
jgi:hypothetical protein